MDQQTADVAQPVIESPLADYRAARAAAAETPVAEAVETPTVPVEQAETPVQQPEQKAEQEQPAEQQERDEQGRFKPKGRDAQARIDRLTWELREREREIERLRTPARTEQPAPTPKPAAVADPNDPEPDVTDATKYPEGQYDRAYLKDQARWEARQEFKAQQREAAEHARAAHIERVRTERMTAVEQSFKEAEAADPGWIERISPVLDTLKPSFALEKGERATGATAIADVIVEADGKVRKALLDHFYSNPNEFQRVSALHPVTAMRELGRLEERLSAALSGPAKTAPVISQAKPPIQPVGSDAHVPQGTRSAKDINSLAEWRARKARG